MRIFASKKFLIIAGIILALFIGIAIGVGPKQYKQNNTSSVINSAIPSTKESVSENIVSENKEENNKLADEQSNSDSGLVKIVRVIDGDTIEIAGGERVRYIGIDTPETVDPRKLQCFGVEASNKNKELVEGKMARLEKDITERDKYGRLLRYVWVGDVFVNLELVKQGFAYSYSYPPGIKYQDLFVKAQQEAREAKRGLWNSCPAVAPAGTQIPVLPVINAKNYYGLIRANKGIVK